MTEGELLLFVVPWLVFVVL